MDDWTKGEIRQILMELDKQEAPFPDYTLIGDDGSLNLLGRGGFARVFEAKKRYMDAGERYAVKVLGFGDHHVDSSSFCEAVEAQKMLCEKNAPVVRVYDYVDITVELDEQNHVQRVRAQSEEQMQHEGLRLQFIIMEKLMPVLIEGGEKQKLSVPRLEKFHEKEIIKIASDVGEALRIAHENWILHRDVKLENIFYSPTEQKYKLGDFGISKVTEYGVASTTAYTKGYGAPEVVKSSFQKYDQTSDIYSFGMTLYVLLNELRFPESQNYNVNFHKQYQKDYLLPRCEHGSGELFGIVKKMCMYDPDDRYQTMEEIQQDFQRLVYQADIQYKQNHKSSALVLGMVFLCLGTISWTLMKCPVLDIEISQTLCLLIAFAFGKCFLYLAGKKKTAVFVTLGMVGLGIYLLTTQRVSPVLVLYLLCTILSDGPGAGVVSALLVAVKLILKTNFLSSAWKVLQGYEWVAVTCFSLAVVLCFYYLLLSSKKPWVAKLFFYKERYWIAIGVGYVAQIGVGFLLEKRGFYFKQMMDRLVYESLLELNLAMAGVAGLLFCTFWIIREKLLIRTR